MSERRLVLPVLALAAFGMALCLVLDARAAFAGWLLAFVLAGLAPVGAVALLLIGRLTGASWTAPLVPLAAATPLLCVLALPVLAGYALIFAWSAGGLDPASGQPVWLSPAFFILRSAVILGGWSWLALQVARGRTTMLTAGLGLLAHGLFVSVAAYDWVLSVQPGWVDTSMGMNLAAQQIGAACACVGLFGLASDRQAPAYVGLLAAALLGVAYLALMDYIIVWYGNLPDKVSWYVRREQGLWWVLVPLATALGLVVPLPVLGFGGGWRRKLALASGFGLAGFALYDIWMITPAFGAAALPAAVCALAIQLGALFWAAARKGATVRERVAHAA